MREKETRETQKEKFLPESQIVRGFQNGKNTEKSTNKLLIMRSRVRSPALPQILKVD